MSYRIQYDCKTDKFEITANQTFRFPVFLTVLGVTLLLVMALRSDVVSQIRSVLIPGEDAITVQAFQTMYADLRSGSGLYDAFRDFCRLVIHGA